MNRVCRRCGELIPRTRRSDALYCSKRCHDNAYWDRHGERFKVQRRAETAKKPLVLKSCLNCGKEFPQGRIDQVYCSQKCNARMWEVRHSGEISKRRQEQKDDRLRRRLERAATSIPILRTCAADGCNITSADDKSFKTGYCNTHYLREFRARKRAAALGLRTCPQCGADISRSRTNAVYCSSRCSQRFNAAKDRDTKRIRKRFNQNVRRARKYNNPGYVEFSLEQGLEVVAVFDSKCAYCGEKSDALQMDHVMPLARGGPHCLENITPACLTCNTSKHDSTVDEWRARQARDIQAGVKRARSDNGRFSSTREQ